MNKFFKKTRPTIIIAAVTLVIGGLSGFIIGQNMNFSKAIDSNQNNQMGSRSRSGFGGFGRYGSDGSSNGSPFSGNNGDNSGTNGSNSDGSTTGA